MGTNFFLREFLARLGDCPEEDEEEEELEDPDEEEDSEPDEPSEDDTDEDELSASLESLLLMLRRPSRGHLKQRYGGRCTQGLGRVNYPFLIIPTPLGVLSCVDLPLLDNKPHMICASPVV